MLPPCSIDPRAHVCTPGALAGALHGSGWIPERWWEALGDSEAGRAIRDGALEAGLKLEGLSSGGGGEDGAGADEAGGEAAEGEQQ
jgi:hypothetical protein